MQSQPRCANHSGAASECTRDTPSPAGTADVKIEVQKQLHLNLEFARGRKVSIKFLIAVAPRQKVYYY